MELNLQGELIIAPNDPRRVNPCIQVYGFGPDGKTCKACVHFYRKKYSKTYLKCDLRRNSNGPATDHRAGWAACGKYEEAKP